jgi:hypothetical protein
MHLPYLSQGVEPLAARLGQFKRLILSQLINFDMFNPIYYGDTAASRRGWLLVLMIAAAACADAALTSRASALFKTTDNTMNCLLMSADATATCTCVPRERDLHFQLLCCTCTSAGNAPESVAGHLSSPECCRIFIIRQLDSLSCISDTATGPSTGTREPCPEQSSY